MTGNEYMSNGHITELGQLLLESDVLSPKVKSLVLFHLYECSECMEKYLDSFEDEDMLETLSDTLEISILQQIPNCENRIQHHQKRSIQYIKLAIAVCMTMVMSLSGAFEFVEGLPKTIMEHVPVREQGTYILDDVKQGFEKSISKILGILNMKDDTANAIN